MLLSICLAASCLGSHSFPSHTKNRRATPAEVLRSAEAYERWRKEKGLLRLLAVGDKEIAAGAGHSLDDVLQDADKLLSAIGDRTARECVDTIVDTASS